jgi:multicomponent Na+:H+ antiporter subunit E
LSIQLVLNISIAFLWMLLNDQWSSMNFLSGYIIGLALIFIMRRFFPTPFYLKKLLAMVKLLLVFLEELILSSIFVIQKVINPTWITVPTSVISICAWYLSICCRIIELISSGRKFIYWFTPI